MKPLIELSIKLFAAYLVLSNSSYVINLALWRNDGDLLINEAVIWVPIIGYLIIPLIMGVILWFMSPRIADRLDYSDSPSISEKGVISAGAFVVGLYWLLHSIGVVLGQYVSQQTINWGHVVVFVMSFFLIFSGQAIVVAYIKLRRFGDSE